MITKDDIMNMSMNDCVVLFNKQRAEIDKLNRQVEKLGRKCNRYERKLTVQHFGGEENIPKKEKKHGKPKHRTFAGFRGYGYYSLIENDVFVIGEVRHREGGELYRGKYFGANTPYLKEIRNENPRMYNSIVKYFGYV